MMTAAHRQATGSVTLERILERAIKESLLGPSPSVEGLLDDILIKHYESVSDQGGLQKGWFFGLFRFIATHLSNMSFNVLQGAASGGICFVLDDRKMNKSAIFYLCDVKNEGSLQQKTSGHSLTSIGLPNIDARLISAVQEYSVYRVFFFKAKYSLDPSHWIRTRGGSWVRSGTGV